MSDEKKPHKITFKIDKNKHEITSDQNPVTGQFLRDLPPPVPADYDLWLRARGGEDDKVINPEDSVAVENGDHFYTAKKVIAPGNQQYDRPGTSA